MSEPVAYYCEDRNFRHIETVARRLDDPKTVSFDDRRDLANLLNLVLSEMRKLPVEV